MNVAVCSAVVVCSHATQMVRVDFSERSVFFLTVYISVVRSRRGRGGWGARGYIVCVFFFYKPVGHGSFPCCGKHLLVRLAIAVVLSKPYLTKSSRNRWSTRFGAVLLDSACGVMAWKCVNVYPGSACGAGWAAVSFSACLKTENNYFSFVH